MEKDDVISNFDESETSAFAVESWIRCILENLNDIDSLERDILDGKRSKTSYQKNSDRMSSDDVLVSNRARIFRCLILESLEFDGFFAENIFFWAESLGIPEDRISTCYQAAISCKVAGRHHPPTAE